MTQITDDEIEALKVDADYERIWLSPNCEDNSERTWCGEPQGDCGDCDTKETEYVRADLYEQLRARLKQAEAERDEAWNEAVEFAVNAVPTDAGFNFYDGNMDMICRGIEALRREVKP